MISTNAIVMAAASTHDGDMAAIAPGGSKARIPINGRPAISYVIDNLQACDLISNVTLVCDKATSELAPNADTYVEANGDGAGDILAGVRATDGAERCLVISGDMPLASSEAIADFLTHAPKCDVIYPVVERNDVEEFFPDRNVHYVGTSDGHFTGSGILLFRPEVALSRENLLTALLNARRNPASLVGLLGPALAFKMLVSRLSVRDFEGHLSTALGLNCRVFVSHYPELIVSIDSPEDIRLIEDELNG